MKNGFITTILAEMVDGHLILVSLPATSQFGYSKKSLICVLQDWREIIYIEYRKSGQINNSDMLNNVQASLSGTLKREHSRKTVPFQQETVHIQT